MARYDELLAKIPKGDFYNADGTILPNSDKPYTFKLKTTGSGLTYDIFLNATYVTTVTSDTDSLTQVNLILRKGDNTIEMKNRVDGSVIRSYVTTRDWATWLAGVADVIGPMDDAITEVKGNRDLETVNFSNIDPVWGRRLRNKNSYGYSIETYRDILRVLHKAYRRFGGRLAGVQEAVAIFSQVTPLIYPITKTKQWRLGADFIKNPWLRDYTRAVTSAVTSINAGGAGVSISPTFYFPDMGTATLSWRPDIRKFTWTDQRGAYGVSDAIPTSGSTNVNVKCHVGNDTTLTSLMGPWNTTTYYKLAIDISGRGIVYIDLPQSTSLSAAALAIIIQDIFDNDDRYGVGLGITVTNTGNVIQISAAGIVTLHPVRSKYDAAHVIFGIPWSWATTSSGVTINPGDLTKVIPSTFQGLPLSDGENTYRVIIETTPPLSLEVVDASAGAWLKVNVAGISSMTIPSGTPIWVEGQLPYATQMPPISSEVNISIVDCSKLTSSGPQVNDSFTIGHTGESTLPDSWYKISASLSTYVDQGVLHDTTLVVSSNGTAYAFGAEVRSTALQYKGFPIRVGAWVAHHLMPSIATFTTDTVAISISFDGGLTFPATSSITVPPNAVIPTEVYINTTIPTDATKIIVKLSGSGSGSTTIRFEEVYFKVIGHTALNLGHPTVPRAANRGKRGYACYIWSPDVLLDTEMTQIGLPQGTIGHIDYVAPAQSIIERFLVNDVTGGLVKNVVGAFTATDFNAGTLTHMQVIARSPARFSYAAPVDTNIIQGERVYPTTNAPYTITLSTSSDQDLTKVILYENGIPITHDILHFTDARTITLDTAPNTTKVYTIDYNRLIRFESAVLTLPSNYTDYLWFIDTYVSTVLNMVPTDHPIEVGVQFDANYEALLKERSDRDQSISSLISDDGHSRTVVDTGQWEYLDSTTIRIAASIFNPNNIYTLKHTTRSIQPTPRATIVLELRQSDSLGTVTAQPYIIYNINDPVPPKRYFQLRVTFSGVQDMRDIKLYSCCLKGLNLFGTGVPLLKR